MKILALAGKRKSGKTLAADLIVDIGLNMGIDIKKRSFHYYLKQMYSRVAGIQLDDNPSDKELIDLYRYYDQINRKVPIGLLFSDVAKDDFIVIDGVQLIEQVDAIKTRGGVIWKIEADKSTRESRGGRFCKEIDSSIYETEIGDLSSTTFQTLGGGVLYNNTPVQNLHKDLDWLIRKVYLGGLV